MSFQQELATAEEYGISPAVVVEQILPVANKTRKVSLVSTDYFFFSTNYSQADSKFKKNLRRYLGNHAIDFAIMNDGGVEGIYFFNHGERQDVYPVLEKIRRLGKAKGFQYRIVEMEGALLGYPACCINAYKDDKKQGQLHEGTRIQRQISDGSFVKKSGSAFEVKKDVLHAFFTFGFYPCKPDCEHAIEIGTKILDSMQGEEHEAYSRALLNNTLLASLDIASYAYKNLGAARELIRRSVENEPLMKEIPVRLI